uniref:Uncharacterized protein n=1 Tax=Clandestinovirus TaxID=2831644 RepID=A0A8F8KNJ0_9VIRU|nr:hypothetical protein KOM_12_146 [Clandestinovirus]
MSTSDSDSDYKLDSMESEEEDDIDAWMIEIKDEKKQEFETAITNWDFNGETIEISNLFEGLTTTNKHEFWIYNMYGTRACLDAFVKQYPDLYEQLDNRYITLSHC